MALRGEVAGLLGVAAVLLLDRDREPQPAAAGGMRPYSAHFRDAGGFELIPHRAGAVRASIERIIVGGHPGNRTKQNWIIAVHKGCDADRRLLLFAAGVIAGPFANR